MKLLNEAGFRKAIEMIYSDIFRKATSTTLGKIKVGKNLTIKSDGTLDAKDSLPPVGSCILLDIPTNPAELYLNTIWQKIEGKYIKTTSGSGASSQIGGSNTKTLSVSNMPSHKHTASQSAHTHTQPTHYHNLYGGYGGDLKTLNESRSVAGIGYYGSTGWVTKHQQVSSAGGDNTGSAQPSITIGNSGSGTAFNIEPAYITLHLWKRIS